MQESLQNGLHDFSKLISLWLLIPGVGSLFGAECEKRGMLIRVAGDNIMLSPPLIMTPDEVEEIISKYGDALKATEERIAELKAKRG